MPSISNKGPIVFTKYLINGLKPLAEKIDVYYFSETNNPLDLGVGAHKISFLQKIDFTQYDIIHTTMLMPDLYVFYHRKNIKAKIITSMHNIIEEDLYLNYNPFRAFFMKLLWRLAISRPIQIIVSSIAMKSYYERFIGGFPKIKIITYGITENLSEPIINEDILLLNALKVKYKIIGSIGLTIKRKGFEQLIKFLKINLDFAVVIIGDGPERKKLEEMSKFYGVSDRFKILGFRDNSSSYYSWMDIYASVSHSEGFGLAMLQAMPNSIPVICSDLSIYKEYFTKDYVGLFKLNDIEDLNNEIIRIDTNREYFAQKSNELYQQNFREEIMCRNHFDLYQDLLD